MNKIEFLIADIGIPVFYVKLVLGFLISFLITFISIPTIIQVSKRKNLMDEPSDRSSHIRKIPNLGGIAIFFSIGVCASIFAYELFDLYKFLFASLVILLYIGVMDDILMIKAYKKLFAQILVSALIVIGSDVRIRDLFGIFGIHELNYFISVAFSIFTFVILINAFNLIDGIDGLAGTYSVLCSALFGGSYFYLGEYNYPLVVFSAIIVGSVLAFLYYNLSKHRRVKIFMGDTGSMILGFLLAFTAINFIDIFIEKKIFGVPMYHLKSAPVIAVAILILPIIDTLNVILIRLFQKKSPFKADKNHIHHRLLSLDLSHKKSTMYIISYYLFMILITYFLRHLENNLFLLIIVGLGFLGAYMPNIILKLKKS
ncbi:MAG: undecaprenyl/decaprenyl-phosphate alpha-N-acetylglucosaminyl 1-phosphate transferase [Flavobacteriaceae bacterium]|jgi:UDP-N-acetylmuramyl pentapeptide phosphotransferase/UDP-N-acetylglucosamine-1-phosphate transferase|nr:undecaprenyl/decaprenyl-phosphate alpha-N-acetylglucosaminyl 1-phosphate transferase [Flavobacteriaceae bacterium]